MRKLIRKAKKNGWSVVRTKKHYLLTWKNGERVTASLTPANNRGIKNFLADMRRAERKTLL